MESLTFNMNISYYHNSTAKVFGNLFTMNPYQLAYPKAYQI